MGQSQRDLRAWTLSPMEGESDCLPDAPRTAGEGEAKPTGEVLPSVCPAKLEWQERGRLIGASCVQPVPHDNHVWSKSAWARAIKDEGKVG